MLNKDFTFQFNEYKEMKAPLKVLALATGLVLPSLGMSQELIPTLQCVDYNPCYEELAFSQTMLEFGEERALEMFFENEGQSIGVTFSEVYGLGYAFLNAKTSNVQSRLAKMMGEIISANEEDSISFKPLEDYRTVEMVQINESLYVAIYKPTAEIVIRRDLAEGESIRVKTTFDNFISNVQQGYERVSKEPTSQKFVGLNHQITDTITMAVFRSVYTSTMGDSHDITGEYFKEENVQYTAWRAIVDKEGEETRSICMSESTNVNGGAGFTSISVVTDGCTPEHEDITVDPHVHSVREEAGVSINGDVTVGREQIINIFGEETIHNTGSDPDYQDWNFSDQGLDIFGDVPDTTTEGVEPARNLFNEFLMKIFQGFGGADTFDGIENFDGTSSSE